MNAPDANHLQENPDDPERGFVQLMQRAADGDKTAFDQLLPLIYAELRAQARRVLARTGRPDDVSTTVLVNETYLKLVGSNRGDWRCRAQFLAYAARTMRSILIDAARALATAKRSANDRVIAVEQLAGLSPTDLVALDAALARLGERDQRLADVVEMHFFAGMTAREIGTVLDVSDRTVERDLAKARILLAMDAAPGGAG